MYVMMSIVICLNFVSLSLPWHSDELSLSLAHSNSALLNDVIQNQSVHARLAGLAKFFSDPRSARDLRVAVLCLRITERAQNMVSKKKRTVPTLVLLGQGLIQEKSCEELALVLSHLASDKHLDADLAVLSLLTTATHLLARFEVYGRFPTRLWTMCKQFNPVGWIDSCEQFLELGADSLDAGYSQHLQQEAWRHGTQVKALQHLTGDEAPQVPQRGPERPLNS